MIEATPPVFRTPHYEKIVAAGKHAFLEKPGAVDVIQGRRMYELADEASKKGLCVVCGNQRRYDNRYQDLVKRMQDGEIGELLAGQCYWNNGSYIGAWANGKEGTEDTLEYQIRNWWCFIWASGDNIVEQHVHNIDVLMWAFGSDRMPVEVTTGLGGRSTDLPCPRYGDRFSHFAIDYDMGNGLRMASYCHQDPNTTPNVSERIVGTKGIFQNLRFTDHKGKTLYAPGKLELDPYIAEHKYLLSAIRSGRRVNELKNLVNSNMVAIAGRMSAFSGKRFKYDWMVKKSEENIVPQNVDLMGKTQDLSLKIPCRFPCRASTSSCKRELKRISTGCRKTAARFLCKSIFVLPILRIAAAGAKRGWLPLPNGRRGRAAEGLEKRRFRGFPPRGRSFAAEESSALIPVSLCRAF